MDQNHLQAMFDGLSAQWQKERAATQLTLGRLIAALEAMPPDTQVANLHDLDSYRGYYSDLYFEKSNGTRLASDLLRDCKSAMGQVFTGYKGGDFLMGATTPLWISSYGQSGGDKLMAVHAGGEIEAEKDD